VVESAACAVGRLEPDGPWLGFARLPDGRYALAIGADDGGPIRQAPAAADELLALAIAYFAESLADPPPQLEATHADLGGLVRAIAASETDVGRRAKLADAIDAIDDGLAGDVVVSRLSAALALDGAGDPVERVLARARALFAR
jgi:hypothetical protein